MDPKELMIKELMFDLDHLRELHTKTLGLVLNLTDLASKDISKEQFLSEVIKQITTEFEFDNGSILLYDNKRDELRLVAAFGSSSVLILGDNEVERLEFNKSLAFSRDNSVAWRVFESHTPLFIDDANAQNTLNNYQSVVDIGSLCCLPLGNTGIINLSNSLPTRFSNFIKRDLVIISQLVEKLLTLNNLQERLRSSQHLIQSLLEGWNLDLKNLVGCTRVEELWGLEPVILCAPQGIAIVENNKIKIVNPALLNLLEEREELVEKDISETILKDIFESLLELKNASIVPHKEYQLTTKSNKILFLDVYLHSFYNQINQKTYYILFIHDLTKQKEITKKLIELEKKELFSELSGGFSHHFNNILSIILNNIESSLRETNIDAIKTKLKSTLEPLALASSLIKNIQLLSGIKEDSEQIENFTSNLNSFLDELLSLTKYKWYNEAQKIGKDITIKKVYNFPNTLAIPLNNDLFRTVIVNLILNAIDAIEKKGTITIKGDFDERSICIQIIDDGKGISEEELKHVFSPFYTTKGLKTSGLGLTVSKEIVESVKGKLEISSKKGEGTTATIILPVISLEKLPHPSPLTKIPTLLHPGNNRILVVDDEEGIAKTLSEMLNMDGFDVKFTTNPVEAKELIERENFGILITDLGMPQINGLELAKIIKEKNHYTKVVLISGWGLQVAEMTKQNVDFFLPKPFKYDQLKEILLQ